MDAAARRRLLVVDDEKLNIDVLTLHLEADFEIDRALDGRSALARLASDPLPDAILLDVNMPGMDGYDLCGRIRADARTAEIPVLFVTALDQDEALCFDVGAQDYVPKPIVPEVLRARLRTQLRLADARARVHEVQHALHAARNIRDRLDKRQEKLVAIVQRRTGADLRRPQGS